MFTEHTGNIPTATKLNLTLQRYLLQIWQFKHPATSITDQNTTNFMLFRPIKAGIKHSYNK